MADDETPQDDAPAAAPRSSTWTWLLPALAFVAGAVLGGVVVAAGTTGDDDVDPLATVTASPTPEPTPTTTSTTPDDVVVSVPGVCLEAAERAETASREVDDVVAAVRDFDARRLQELVDRFQELQEEVESLAQSCRELTGDRIEDGSLITPSPTA